MTVLFHGSPCPQSRHFAPFRKPLNWDCFVLLLIVSSFRTAAQNHFLTTIAASPKPTSHHHSHRLDPNGRQHSCPGPFQVVSHCDLRHEHSSIALLHIVTQRAQWQVFKLSISFYNHFATRPTPKNLPRRGPHVGTYSCLLYTSPSPRDKRQSRMPSSA